MKIALLLILLVIAWAGWRAWATGTMPQAGSQAPDFLLPDQVGKIHRLSDSNGRWRVVYFYPKDDTPGCTTEACTFRDGLARLEAAGAMVMGISVDKPATHRQFAEKYHLNFPLLADAEGKVSRKYGVLMDWMVFRMAKRVTFLIDPGGTIDHVYPQVDPERHAAEILDRLQARNNK